MVGSRGEVLVSRGKGGSQRAAFVRGRDEDLDVCKDDGSIRVAVREFRFNALAELMQSAPALRDVVHSFGDVVREKRDVVCEEADVVQQGEDVATVLRGGVSRDRDVRPKPRENVEERRAVGSIKLADVETKGDDVRTHRDDVST